MQAGGNRARFFAPQTAKTSDASASISNNSESSRDGNFMPSRPTDLDSTSSEFVAGSNNTTSSGSLVSFSKQKTSNEASNPYHPASDSSEGETTAQRTRIVETEMIFKAKREGHGRLNVSGLMKHSDGNAVKTAHQSASIKEVVDIEELGTRSPRQYSGSKLLSKNNTPSHSSAFPHFPHPPQKSSSSMPPSNQLASQAFKAPPDYTSRSDIATEDVSRIKQTSITSHADNSNSHISSRLPANNCDDSIKSLTSAFNRKHPGGSKTSFPSPVSHPSNSTRNARARSPHTPFEDDSFTDTSGSFGSRATRIDSRSFSSGICDDDDDNEPIFQGSERYHASAQKQHGHQEPHGKRGEKRISESGVEGEGIGAPLGKRARTDTYDELPFTNGSNSSMPNSPERDPRDNPQFKKAISQDRRDVSRQDPHLKIFSGQDVDEYVANHADRYEAAKKRWTECSGEDWEKGADELVDKFIKILDFVKENMKIDQHQKEREETSDMLKNAKSKLVAKTGVVVDEGRL